MTEIMPLEKKIALTQLLIVKYLSHHKSTRINILWSGGKDSTVLLHLFKTMFGRIPFQVVFADSSYEFDEIYDFIDTVSKDWHIDLFRLLYRSPTKKAHSKTLRIGRDRAVKTYINTHHIELTFSGIRWSEHFHNINKVCGKRFGVTMIYPILHWTHKDIWDYIKKYNVPYVSLYDQGYVHLESRLSSVKQNVSIA